MDYNKVSTWINDLELLRSSTIKLNEQINFDNVKTFTIDIESENDLGIIIVYDDGHLFFDFMSKEDPMMKSYNWSDKYIAFFELKEKIEEALQKNWTKK